MNQYYLDNDKVRLNYINSLIRSGREWEGNLKYISKFENLNERSGCNKKLKIMEKVNNRPYKITFGRGTNKKKLFREFHKCLYEYEYSIRLDHSMF